MNEISDSIQVLEKNGGDDGTRTRGLCRHGSPHNQVSTDTKEH